MRPEFVSSGKEMENMCKIAKMLFCIYLHANYSALFSSVEFTFLFFKFFTSTIHYNSQGALHFFLKKKFNKANAPIVTRRKQKPLRPPLLSMPSTHFDHP